jgi:hypothetical protein
MLTSNPIPVVPEQRSLAVHSHCESLFVNIPSIAWAALKSSVSQFWLFCANLQIPRFESIAALKSELFTALRRGSPENWEYFARLPIQRQSPPDWIR